MFDRLQKIFVHLDNRSVSRNLHKNPLLFVELEQRGDLIPICLEASLDHFWRIFLAPVERGGTDVAGRSSLSA